MDSANLEAAYVLHNRRYGDSSLIVELYTRGRGRLAALAKGALRARRPSANLQPFQPLMIETRGRGELPLLARAESGGAPLALRGRNLYCGLYLNELLLKLTARQDAHPSLYDDYGRAVGELAGVTQAEPLLRRFEVQLLDHLGLGLSLQLDVDGRSLDAASSYTYQVDAGPRRVAEGYPEAVSGKTLIALREGRFDDATVLAEARTLMRRILHHHLDGRPLRSRELFR